MTQKIDLDAIAAIARKAKERAAERERRSPIGEDGIPQAPLDDDGLPACSGYVGKGCDDDEFILDGSFSRDELLRFAEALGFTDIPVLADAVLALVERVRELEPEREACAAWIDCAGPGKCGPVLDDGTCVRSVSRDCARERADEIRRGEHRE